MTFIEGDQRNVLAVSYGGANSGDMAVHAQSWDPLFVADIDPQQDLDIDALLADKVSMCTHGSRQ